MRGRSKLDSKMGRSKLSLNAGRLAGGAFAPSARHRLGSFVRQRLATSGARNGQASFLESPANTMGCFFVLPAIRRACCAYFDARHRADNSCSAVPINL